MVDNTIVFKEGEEVGKVDGINYKAIDSKYIYFQVDPGKWAFNSDIN